MSLFVLSSKDGWVTIMYQGLDAVGLDQQVLLSLLTKENVTRWVNFVFFKVVGN